MSVGKVIGIVVGFFTSANNPFVANCFPSAKMACSRHCRRYTYNVSESVRAGSIAGAANSSGGVAGTLFDANADILFPRIVLASFDWSVLEIFGD